MENGHILTEIGVREEDTLVLMQIMPKKKKNTENAPTVEKDLKKPE